MNLILLHKTDFTSPDIVMLKGQRFEHLKKVLRVGQGTCVKVGLLEGMLGGGEVIELNTDNITLKVKLDKEAPPALPLTLVCALQRPQTMKKVLQAVIAYGVKKIYFIHSRKVEKSYWDSPLLQEENMRKHILLGLEQSCDTIMPEIHFREQFKPFVEDELENIVGDSIGITAHPMGEKACPAQVQKAVTLCVGPEGGFTPEEETALREAGAGNVKLTDTILRTETAALAACSILAAMRDR